LILIGKEFIMGLDMYAYTVNKGEDPRDDNVKTTELAYWRKFNALHGWMEDLYRDKGGTKPSFNCVPLKLELEDLNELELVLENGKLEPRTGFFFGAQQVYPEDVASALTFIDEARDAIANGLDVYYDSWW